MKNLVGRAVVVRFAVPFVAAAQSALALAQSGAGNFDLSGWNLLAVIAVSGFFGGMVDGLRADRSYKWRFGKFAQEWGTLGDALVGVTAALAIFAFAENIFSVEKFVGPVPIFTFLKLVAWGVLSGYAGTRLLDPLTSKAVKALAQDAAAKAVKEQSSSTNEAQESLSEARSLVTQHIALVSSLPPHHPDKRALDLLVNAKRKYDAVLTADPANLRAQLGLANLHSYRAEYQLKVGDSESLASFDKAISAVTDLIRREPTMAKAYYNRACYRALKAGKHEAPGEAIDDLLKSFELDESLKAYWEGDGDLDTLRQDKRLAARMEQEGRSPA